jgi:ADP-heptose:LPS heptosyltransferase
VNATSVAGNVGSRVPDVRKIAVLRANGLGDFIFALPALAALRRTHPDAEIVLLG